MKSNEYTEIIRHLLQENKELKEEVQILESILHSNITILGEKE
tara:strand:- start:227 stop:355 length:129 start_codon:yes stop_codon:yes gene_type:complete